ncbi:MAG TPA: hypothetical protein VI382_08085 [Candidatus Manganitrophaceae bacterium]|nr:hypothetical protein [Candidatus Manganitrophaceae bacterium]
MKKTGRAFFLAFFLIGIAFPLLKAATEGESLLDMNIAYLEQKRILTRWGRDPFSLPPPSGGEPSIEGREPLSLSAIIYREGKGAAIINDQIVREGDRIEGLEVEQVFSDRVFLREGSRVKELKVRQFLSK